LDDAFNLTGHPAIKILAGGAADHSLDLPSRRRHGQQAVEPGHFLWLSHSLLAKQTGRGE
jgi:hypothetical protein